ncbi:MAG: DUF268 domain-containing protein [Kiritimatiellia bacterium]
MAEPSPPSGLLRAAAPPPALVRRIYHWLLAFGVQPVRAWNALRSLPATVREYAAYRRRGADAAWPVSFNFPSLADRREESGVARGAYFHQDLLVARKVFERNPRRHLDVGSSVQGFVAHVASFRAIEVMDIRPLTTSILQIRFVRHDLMLPPPDPLRGAFDSVSCLHALEHFGLGRYGDPVDPDGWRKGLAHLVDLVAPGGMLYLSVPIGPQRVEFNSHRVFAAGTVPDEIANRTMLADFHVVDDRGELHPGVALTPELRVANAGCWMGCGIYEFRKTEG